MEITISTILNKMEREFKKAYEANDDHAIREHLIVIKTLCGLVLEEKMPTKQKSAVQQKSTQTIELNSNRREDDDQDSNGDSLFDF